MVDARAATGRDDANFDRISFEQPGDEVAAALLEIAQDADFVVEAFAGVRAVIGLYDPAIEGQVDGGTQRVFNFQHVEKISRKGVGLKRKVQG